MTNSKEHRLSHLDEAGHARMVNVGAKPITNRHAIAEGRVRVGAEVAAAIRENSLKKGDLLQVARLGGIQAAKRAAETILLCHPLPLTHVDVQAKLEGEVVLLRASASTAGQTGVEMEAMAAIAGAALNVVDMGKALNASIVIESIRVIEKTGGKSSALAKKPQWQREPLVAILTVSDTRSAGEAEDLATPLLCETVKTALGGIVSDTKCVPDDKAIISQTIRDWIGSPTPPDLILTTGGTGLAPRDVTPEATADVIDRPYPGLLELARSRCLPGKPYAYLSRAIAGIVAQTLIVNLPGSPRGAVETLRLMLDVLPHAIETLRNDDTPHPSEI